MEMEKIKINGGGKFELLHGLYTSLDDDFKHEIDARIAKGCTYSSLLRLLKFPSTSLITPLVNLLLSKYNPESSKFVLNRCELKVTLEDVLFLTGLPIKGKPVIAQSTRDSEAFQRVFGMNVQKMTPRDLCKIATSTVNPQEMRIKAILLLVVFCVIIPKNDGSKVNTTYVQFIEELEVVDDYAWGAALLAFLQYHLENTDKRKSIGGCLWVLLGLFYLRIEKLRNTINVPLQIEELSVPVLVNIMETLMPISKNHTKDYNFVNGVLDSIEKDDILWTPYEAVSLPPALQDNATFVTYVGPIFCNNYVVNHQPQLCEVPFSLPLIKFYDNRGGGGAPNFKKHYKEQLDWWTNPKFADTLPPNSQDNPLVPPNDQDPSVHTLRLGFEDNDPEITSPIRCPNSFGIIDNETVVGDHAQSAGGEQEQQIQGNVVPGFASSSGTGQVNATIKTVSPEAAGASEVDYPYKPPNIGNDSISLTAYNVSNHKETDVQSSEFQCPQSNDQPVKRTRKTAYGWYDGSEDNDVIDVSCITSYKLTSELSDGNGIKNSKGRKCKWDLKPIVL